MFASVTSYEPDDSLQDGDSVNDIDPITGRVDKKDMEIINAQRIVLMPVNSSIPTENTAENHIALLNME